MRRKKAIVDRLARCRTVPAAIAAFVFLAVSGLAWVPDSAAQSDGPVPIVFDARIIGDANRTRFVADMTGVADAAVFTLADPYRIVVDMSEVGFRLPDDAGQKGRGLFSAFRYGLISRGKSRIVLDVSGPVKVDKSFVQVNGNGARPIILRSIVSMAHDLGMEVVAEGAESDQDVHDLFELGCEYAQGYFFGEPMNAKEAQKFLAQILAEDEA